MLVFTGVLEKTNTQNTPWGWRIVYFTLLIYLPKKNYPQILQDKNWLVVEPTHLKNMLVKMGSSSSGFGVKIKKCLSCHHLEKYHTNVECLG